MKQSLRLSIPTPCSEDWEKMLPAERGRHCEQCCKTVVDFTGMSDGEVLQFFKERSRGGSAEATGGVCGRFAGDQLGRELAPTPVQRNGVKGWPWVVAGALALGHGPDGGGAGGGKEKRAVDVRKGGAGVYNHIMGKPMSQLPVAAPVFLGDTMLVPDTSSVDMGVPLIAVGELSEDKIGVDTAELPTDTVVAWTIQKNVCTTGDVVIIRDTTIDSDNPVDTISRIKSALDTVVSVVKDTVAAVVSGFRSDEVVRVFPNPVVRGGMMHLEWHEGGRYQLVLVSARGAVVQERMVEVAGKGQVDQWMVPGGLAAGVYFLRMARPGEKVCTKEIVVE